MVTDLLVIPSAKLIDPELQAEFGPIPPALIPLDGRPAVRYILDAAPPGSRAVIAAHEGIELLREAIAHVGELSLADVGVTASLGATVQAALAGTEIAGMSRLVVNFADTVVPGLPPAGDAIAYRVERDPYRWTAFSVEPPGVIGEMTEKGVTKSGEALPIFVGAFAFADPPAFCELLAQALARPAATVDPFYAAVADYSRRRGPSALHLAEVWHDFGHLDTYYRTRQRLFIDRRAFNSVEVDTRRGVIRKRSTNAAKLAHEINWYEQLPPLAAVLAPRILHRGSVDGEAFVDLEFYGYPPLADAYLYGAWDLRAWDVALEAVEDAARLLHSEPLELPEAECRAALDAMYVTKTDQRLAEVLADPAFDPLRGDQLTIDGRPGLGLDGALAVLDGLRRMVGLCDPRPLGIIHGDLCLSNILYDRRNGIVRLIDPRGSFGALAIHGDPLYDHAKLAHSIDGDYDHLVRGLFRLEVTRGAAQLDVHLTAAQRSIKAVHRRRAERILGTDSARVSLIEGLLFLTMVPLHADRPRSQLAFLLRGLGIVSALAQEGGLARVTGGRLPMAA